MMGKLHLLWYLREVYRELPGSWKQKTRILRGLKHCILDYVSDSGDITYEKLLKRFGEPKQVAFTYVNEMETDELLANIRNGRKLVNIITITALTFVMIWLGYMTMMFLEVKNAANGQLVVGEIEVFEQIEYGEGDK